MPKIQLYSHHLCPFLQRVVFLLNETGYKKGVDYEVTYFEVGNPPEWFKQLSPPNGRAPLFVINGQHFFDAATVNELLNDTLKLKKRPTSALARAREREFSKLADNLLNHLRGIFSVANEADYLKAKELVFNNLKQVEAALPADADYFNGTSFSLTDADWGGFFSLILFHDFLRQDAAWQNLPKTKRWGEYLVAKASLKASRFEPYKETFDGFFSKFNSYCRVLVR
jgi:glutathione S-transferase